MQTNLLAYFIDNFGDRDGLFFWDPMVESNYAADIYTLSADSNHTIKSQWFSQIKSFMNNYELQKWGRTHLVSLSSGLANPGKLGDPPAPGTLNVNALYAAFKGVPEEALSLINDFTNTELLYFNDPNLDFVSMHAVIATDNTRAGSPVTFPLGDLATLGGPTS